MIYAMIDGQKRQPSKKGENTVCPGCGGTLRAVLPQFKVAHWRHEKGDCDSWSEPEGPWHLAWKALFHPEFCEVFLRDQTSQEIHRADVLCPGPDGKGVVLELQHSSISEEEREARETFYKLEHRMFWLLNMDKTSSLSFNFGISIDFNDAKSVMLHDRKFYPMTWMGRGTILDKWKQSTAHVFLNHGRYVYYLATNASCRTLVASQGKHEFALAKLTIRQFLIAVAGDDMGALRPRS
ncbi:competence protein CoiA family protein [Pseudomonas syringae]|nr:competence protein CoiA family protein [Pseudomonas syringae]